MSIKVAKQAEILNTFQT